MSIRWKRSRQNSSSKKTRSYRNPGRCCQPFPVLRIYRRQEQKRTVIRNNAEENHGMETIRREERIVMEMRHIAGGNSKAPLPGETYDQYMIRMAWLRRDRKPDKQYTGQ